MPVSSTDEIIDGTILSPSLNAAGAVANNISIGVTGAGTLNILGGGQLTNAGTILGVDALSSGTADLTDANTIWTMQNNLVVGFNGTGTLVMLNGSVVNDVDGDVGSQSGASGTAVLDGVGTIWNNSGTLYAGDNGTGTLVISDGAVINSNNSYISFDGIGASGVVDIDGAGTRWTTTNSLIISNGNGTSGTLGVTGGAVVNDASAIVGNLAGSVGVVTLSDANSAWNNGTLVIGNAGNGTVTISNTALLTASTSIAIGSGSVLNIGAADGSAATVGGTLTTPAIFLNPNSSIVFNHTDLANLVNGNITGSGAIIQEGSGTTILTGTNSYTGGTTVSAGTLQGSSSGLTGNIINNSHVIFDQTSSGTFNGAISGSGDVTKNNSGTVILTSANTQLGGTFISGGTLQIQDDNNLGATLVPVTFITDPNHPTLARALGIGQTLTLQRDILLNADGGIDTVGTNTVFTPGIISGTGGLTKTGTGTLLFNAPFAYTGNTVIQQGIIAAGAPNVLVNSPNVFVTKNGTLDLAGFPQAITNLQNNGVVNISDATPTTITPNTLTVTNSLSGNGTINVNTDLVDGTNDFISINDHTEGSQKLAINNINQSIDPPAGTALKLVKTNDGIASFSGGTDAGSFEYVVLRGNPAVAAAPDPFSWYLVRRDLLEPGTPIKDLLSSTATAAIGTFSAGVPMFYSDMQTLTARMGDLRLGETGGVWTRAFGNKMQVDNQISRPFNQNLGGVQAGFDKSFNNILRGHVNAGFFADYMYASRQFHQNATGATQAMSLGAYATWFNPAGWYADLVGKYTQFWNDFQASTTGGRRSDANYKIPAFGGSIEVGRKINFVARANFFIEPQLQVATVRLDSAQYVAGNGLQIAGSNQTSLEGRIGLRSGIQMTTKKNAVIEPYVQASLIQEFTPNNTIKTNSNSYQTQLPQTVKRFGVGVASHITNRTYLYGEYNYAVGKNFREPVALNIGLRVSW